MRRAKSLVFIAVIAMMLFGLVAVANAAVFSDISGNAASADIVKLKALGVIDGYPDGTFQPAGNITRAEFAKIASGIAGFKDMGDALKDSSKFSDVPAGAWFTGWVNLAASQGYVQGYPDGTFKPNANITAAEVITVTLRILGYDDRLVGEWPTDYLAKAKSLGVTDDLTFSANAPASRALVCQLAAAVLEENVVYWDNDKGKFVEDTVGDEEETYSLIDDVFEGAVVSDALITDYELNNGTLTLEVYLYDNETDSYAADSISVDVSEDAVFDGTGGPFGLAGVIADYVMDTDEDELIFAGIKNYGVVLDDEVTFSNVDEGTFDVEVDDEDYSTAPGGYVTTYDILEDGVMDGFYPFKFVLNEDGDVVYTTRTGYKVLRIVDEINLAANKIEWVDGGTTTLDEDDDNLIVKGGANIGIEDLKAGDGLYIETSLKGFNNRLTFQTKTATGEFTRYAAGDYIYIDGTKYDLNPGDEEDGIEVFNENNDEVEDANINTLLNNDVTVYMNGLGQVIAILGTESSRIEGIAIDSGTDPEVKGEATSWVKMFTKDGKEVTYDCEEDYEFELPEAGTLISIRLNSDGDIDSIEEPADYTEVALEDYAIGEVEEDYDKIDIDDTDAMSYKFKRSGTIIVDATALNDEDGTDWDELELATWADVEDSDNITATLYYDGSDIEWLVVTANLGVETAGLDRAIYLGYYDNGDDLVAQLFLNGEVVEYTIDSTDVIGEGVAADAIVEFDVDGDEATSIAALEDGEDEVADIKYADNIITIGETEFQIDSDTQIVDYTGDEPVAITFDEINEGDTVQYADYNDDGKAGVLAIIIVVDAD